MNASLSRAWCRHSRPTTCKLRQRGSGLRNNATTSANSVTIGPLRTALRTF